MKRSILLGLLAVFCLALAASAFAEDREDGQAKAETQMRKEMVKLKYIHATDAYQLLQAYKSAPRPPMGQNAYFPGGNIVASKDANQNEILVLSDTPEVVEKMLALIKEIDVKPAELQFTVQVIMGSEAPEDKGDEALKNDPIIRELRGLLKYKTFTALDATLLRVVEGEMAEAKIGPRGDYVIRLKPKFIRDGAQETVKADIEFFKPEWTPVTPNSTNAQIYNLELVRTSLSFKPGEKTVVGVSKSAADKGLILIISAKVTK